MDKDVNVVGVAADGFVDGVVDDFFYKLMQAASIGGTNIHTGSFADRLQTF